jgi:hypothetical protein
MTVNIQLMCQEIRGKTYGIGRCTVHVGGTEIDGVAVVAGDDRHVSSEEGAGEWLALHGLGKRESRRFVTNGLKAWDESQGSQS